MRTSLKSVVLICTLSAGSAASGFGQSSPSDLKARVDAVVSAAYQSARARFPCTLKAQGKAKMLRWQVVEKCLNGANASVDWEDLSQRLQKIAEEGGFQTIDISSAVESSLTAQAIPYSEVFVVKGTEALLPLSNSLLKFLPPDSLAGLPVYNNSGVRLGTFSGVFSFAKSGGLVAANSYQMSVFQYTDLDGNMQTPTSRLLLDSFGVPWKEAVSQPGFRLPSDKLFPRP